MQQFLFIQPIPQPGTVEFDEQIAFLDVGTLRGEVNDAIEAFEPAANDRFIQRPQGAFFHDRDQLVGALHLVKSVGRIGLRMR